MESISEVVDSGMCISCGSCLLKGDEIRGRMVENRNTGMYEPAFIGNESGDVAVCPGAGYRIESLGDELFSKPAHRSIDLGNWNCSFAVSTSSKELSRRASSGGIMTAIASYLLESKEVDGVLTTRIEYENGRPRPVSFIAESIEQLVDAQGSKYCPVPVFSGLGDALVEGKKYLFIGTPCQVAGLRLQQKHNPLVKACFPFTMANFCGGFRDLRETDSLIARAGFSLAGVNYFQYRGGGQPGFMKIRSSSGEERKMAYRGYARATGFIKHLRCRLCVDATGELADFSCGDAWVPRLLESGKAWSILMCRSKSAEAVLRSMIDKGLVEVCPITVQEIAESQAGNLNTKKKRQAARLRLYRLLGYRLPSIEEGYHPAAKGTLFELRVHLSHTFFYFLERISLYRVFAKLINRYPKDMT